MTFSTADIDYRS